MASIEPIPRPNEQVRQYAIRLLVDAMLHDEVAEGNRLLGELRVVSAGWDEVTRDWIVWSARDILMAATDTVGGDADRFEAFSSAMRGE